MIAEMETEKATVLNLAGAYLEEAKAKLLSKQNNINSLGSQIAALDIVKDNLGKGTSFFLSLTGCKSCISSLVIYCWNRSSSGNLQSV